MRRRLVEDDCDARREALQEVLESCELHTKTPQIPTLTAFEPLLPVWVFGGAGGC